MGRILQLLLLLARFSSSQFGGINDRNDKDEDDDQDYLD